MLLTEALDRSIAGDDAALFAMLARDSGLPGPHANLALAAAFAKACAQRGGPADAVALRMARLDANRAPGATALEFLPVCGVRALGARAAGDPGARAELVAVLHDAAADLRFRVRDAVPDALAQVGAAAGEALVKDAAAWMDGFFQAAAVLRALSLPAWLSTLHSAEEPTARLDEAFALAAHADRSAARYPGFKALLDALAVAPTFLAARFGVPVFDVLERWANEKNPALREVVAKSLEGKALAKRHGADVLRVRRALEASAPTRRDPRTDVGPTRRRGRKR